MKIAGTPEVANVLAGPGVVDGDSGPIHGSKQVATAAEAALSAALDRNLLHRPADQLLHQAAYISCSKRVFEVCFVGASPTWRARADQFQQHDWQIMTCGVLVGQLDSNSWHRVQHVAAGTQAAL